MASLIKVLAQVASELRLLENVANSLKDPYLEADIHRAEVYHGQKNVPALLASLVELQSEIAKIKHQKRTAERITPLIPQLGALQFNEEMAAQKKKILNQFLNVRRQLRGIRTVAGSRRLINLIDQFDDREEIFLHDLFQADSPDKVLDAISQFSRLSGLIKDAVTVLGGAEVEEGFKNEQEMYQLLKKKQVELRESWNELPGIFLKPFEGAVRRIKPSSVVIAVNQAGVGMLLTKT